MTLNGRDINPLSNDFAYFNFLQSIQEEANYAEQFKSLGLLGKSRKIPART